MHCFEDLSIPFEALHTKDLQQFRADVSLLPPFPNRGVGRYPYDILPRITKYAKREFTYESDTLKAFQGILQSFGRMRYPVTHASGALLVAADYFNPPMSVKERFLFGLSFQILGTSRSRRRGFPSWSWTGWKLAENSSFFIAIYFRRYGKQKWKTISVFDPDVISVEFVDGTVMPWEQVHQRLSLRQEFDSDRAVSGLRIVGTVFDIELTKKGDNYVNKTWSRDVLHGNFSVHSLDLQLSHEEGDSVRIVYLILTQSHTNVFVLLLRELEEQGAYERVGTSTFFPGYDSHERPLSKIQALDRVTIRREESTIK